MVGPPAKTGGSSHSGSLPDVLLQLGTDVRARLVSSRSSSVLEIADLEGRVKACLDEHGQRLAALEQASRAVEGSAPKARSPDPAPLAEGPGNATLPPQVADDLREEIQSDITCHLKVMRTEVERELACDFTSRLDTLRHEVDRRLSEMTAALESLAQSKSSEMSPMAVPPQASRMEKANRSEGWREAKLKAPEVTSPEFGSKAQLSSARVWESSSAHPLMSAIEPLPNKSAGRRRLIGRVHPV